MNDEVLLTKLREAFRAEAGERLASMTSNLLALEKTAHTAEADAHLEVVYREAHSLKGASGAIDLRDIEILCQSMESVFSAMKKKTLLTSAALFDTLHEAVATIEGALDTEGVEFCESDGAKIDSLTTQLDSLRLAEPEQTDVPHAREGREPVSAQEVEVVQNIAPRAETPVMEIPPVEAAAVAKPRTSPTADTANRQEASHPADEHGAEPARFKPQIKSLSSGTVRIASDKLDTLLLKVEELVSLKLMGQQNQENMTKILGIFETWEKKRSQIESRINTLRVRTGAGADILDGRDTNAALSRLIDHVDWSREHLHHLGAELKKAIRAGSENQYSIGRMVDDLLDDVKKVTMLPFSTLLDIFPKMIRDLARSQGKEIELKIKGGDIEIDKRILEEMKDPLIHILRNCADHGLEDPSTRESLAKTRAGAINVEISQTEGDKVAIVISDDGKGIDPARVRSEAIDRGIISRDEAEKLDDEAAVGLIFRSGVSTSPTVTQISGRGLGMAIVQEGIEKLGGSLSIKSTTGEGTSLRIDLPVTLATFRGILVRSGGRRFIVPSIHVDRIVRFAQDTVRTIEGTETIKIDGHPLSLVELSEILGLRASERRGTESTDPIAIVLGAGHSRIAFRVDGVLSEQEVLVKSLGRQLARVRNIAGVTILGSGKPVLIVNVNDLLKSASRAAKKSRRPPAAAGDVEETEKSILIAEDSITSRMLLKNILESAGYMVTTAVDGLDAFTSFQAGRFDLVVSDVEMPRMNGFELASRIRSDPTAPDTPVVLVTALKSPEDRERGFDAGANAYIVKGNFDQSNLLDTLKRLL